MQRAAKRKELDACKLSHHHEISFLKENHQQQIGELKQAHNTALASLNETHQQDIAQLRSSHDSYLSSLNETHRTKVAALESQLQIENHRPSGNGQLVTQMMEFRGFLEEHGQNLLELKLLFEKEKESKIEGLTKEYQRNHEIQQRLINNSRSAIQARLTKFLEEKLPSWTEFWTKNHTRKLRDNLEHRREIESQYMKTKKFHAINQKYQEDYRLLETEYYEHCNNEMTLKATYNEQIALIKEEFEKNNLMGIVDSFQMNFEALRLSFDALVRRSNPESKT